MQAYYETRIEVPEETIKLPEDILPDPVKLAVIYKSK